MTHLSRRPFLATPAATLFAQEAASSPAPAPLFRDPIYDGASDPVGTRLRHWRGAWWMITDHLDGLGVFRSADALDWTRRSKNILRETGSRR